MLQKKESPPPVSGQALNTIIGRGTLVEGTMKVENSVRIDGIFKGELTCSGALTISQAGEVYAHLEGQEIYINGVVRGTVRAERVRLDSQARFIGDVYAKVLAVTEGAVFHGSCSMETETEQIPKPPPPPEASAAVARDKGTAPIRQPQPAAPEARVAKN
ncbi:MAG: polymer-forming cytoskeletal protein [Candidatus Latescibacterota bacterium]|jgi:cytoskeletal protein CcmA (bactofilin family)